MNTSLSEHKVLTINSRSERREESYLVPDTVDGMAYLRTIKELLK